MIDPNGELLTVIAPFSGQCDANGKFTTRIPARPGYWRSLQLTGKLTAPTGSPIGFVGAPIWDVTSGSLHAGSSLGLRGDVGPFLSSPGDSIQVDVIGALPGVNVSGSIQGVESILQNAIARAYQPSPNTIAINSTAPRTRLYPDGVTPVKSSDPSFLIAAGGSATPRFTLPVGASQIRILATAAGLKFTYQIYVGGHQTVEQYFGDPNAPGSPTPPATPTLPFTIAVENDWDTQLDFSVIGDPSNALNFYVSALTQPETPGQAGASQSVFVPSPALWQAPNLRSIDMTAVIAAGAQVQYVTAAAGQVIRLFGMTYTLDVAGGAGTGLSFYDGDPNSGGVRNGGLSESGTGPFEVDGHGAPVTSPGNGFFAKSDTAVTVRGFLFVSRG